MNNVHNFIIVLATRSKCTHIRSTSTLHALSTGFGKARMCAMETTLMIRPQEGLSGMCNRTKTILLTSCQRVDISKRTRARGVHVTRKFVARCGETSVWSTGGAVVNRKLPRVDTKQRARDVSIVIGDARCRSVSATCLQTKMRKCGKIKREVGGNRHTARVPLGYLFRLSLLRTRVSQPDFAFVKTRMRMRMREFSSHEALRSRGDISIGSRSLRVSFRVIFLHLCGKHGSWQRKIRESTLWGMRDLALNHRAKK